MRIDAIGNRYVHQPILAGERHCRLGTFFGEREESAPLPSSHNHRKHVAHTGRHSLALHIRNPFSGLEPPLYNLPANLSASGDAKRVRSFQPTRRVAGKYNCSRTVPLARQGALSSARRRSATQTFLSSGLFCVPAQVFATSPLLRASPPPLRAWESL